MIRENVVLGLLFFYLNAVFSGSAQAADTSINSKDIKLSNVVNFIYQISEDVETFIKRARFFPVDEAAALAQAKKEKILKSKLPTMVMTDSKLATSYKFPAENTELKFDKVQKKYFLNGQALNVNGSEDFQKIYQDVSRVLNKKQASLFQEIFFSKAEAWNIVGLAILAAAILVVHWGLNKLHEVQQEKFDQYLKKAWEQQQAEALRLLKDNDQVSKFTDVYYQFNSLVSLKCLAGKPIFQAGDFNFTRLIIQLTATYGNELKSIQEDADSKEDFLEQAAELNSKYNKAFSMASQTLQSFNFEYNDTTGELAKVQISVPPCEFRFLAPNHPILITQTTECKKVPLIDPDSRNPYDKNEFLSKLGFNMEAASYCCATNCKDIIKKRTRGNESEYNKTRYDQSHSGRGI